MTKNELIIALEKMGFETEGFVSHSKIVNNGTISDLETKVAVCEITGKKGPCVSCVGIFDDGELKEVLILESIWKYN